MNVKGYFERSNGTRVDVEGVVTRHYVIAIEFYLNDGRPSGKYHNIEMYEVRTANGKMHIQRANATMVTEAKPAAERVKNTVRTMGNGTKVAVTTVEAAPVKLSKAMFEGVKVGKLVKGDKILIESGVLESGIVPTDRVTKGKVAEVISVTYQLHSRGFRRSREYRVETAEGVFFAMSPTVIRKLKNN